MELQDYNCGGYALGTFDWYDIDDYRHAIEQILSDFPKSKVIKFRKIPRLSLNKWNIIAFRIGENSFWDDFHFMKYCRDGKWRGKEGMMEIRELKGSILDTWKRTDGMEYNKKITFIAIPRKKKTRIQTQE